MITSRGRADAGTDIASNLVEAGNKRAAHAGLSNLRFQEGDASNLEGLDDRTFDLVISMFGAMFAPKPFEVAKEMVRVTNISPMLWGVESHVLERFSAAGIPKESVSFLRDTYTFHYQLAPCMTSLERPKRVQRRSSRGGPPRRWPIKHAVGRSARRHTRKVRLCEMADG